jgi:predicted subunit of tRNA(5-methylaminomethyl-2-thiouridylate) methyltransferase
MDLQLLLTILLIFIELIAFAWLIIDIQKSKKKQDKIIELEHQILQVEHQILNLETKILETENNIIDEVKKVNKTLSKIK